jgi:putative ABC transport system permease protein
VWKVTIRGLLAHKVRLLLSAVAVVLGISFMSGTYVLTDSTKRGFDRLFDAIYAGIDLQVRSESPFDEGGSGPGFGDDRTPLSNSVLDTVRAVDGVAAADGFVIGPDIAIFAKADAGDDPKVVETFGPSIGLSVVETDSLTPYTVRTGRLPAADGEVAIDRKTVDAQDFEPGDIIHIRGVTESGTGAVRTFRLVGAIAIGDSNMTGNATIAMFTLPDAQLMLDRVDELDMISIEVDAGEPIATVQDRLNQALPLGVEAVPGALVAEEQQEQVSVFLDLFTLILLAFGFIGVLVGGFVIVNTFTIVVSQRVREMALLRSLGASQGQVVGSVLIEALILGLFASAAGLGGGVLLGAGIKALVTAIGFGPPGGALVVLPRTVFVGLGVGTTLTVLSAGVPAIRAARIPPLAAVRRTEVSASRPSSPRTVAGAAMLVGGLAVLVPMLPSERGGAFVRLAVGAGLLVVGIVLLVPRIARPAARLIGRAMPRRGRIHSVLARSNSQRHARRTGSTASALMIGLTLVTVALVLADSMQASVRKIVSASFRSDLNLATDFSPFPTALRTELARSDTVGSIASLRIGQARISGSTRNLDAIDAAAIDDLVYLGLSEGSVAGLDDDGVIVHERFARDHALEVGDVLDAETEVGTFDLTVRGIFESKGFFDDFVTGIGTFEARVNRQRDFMVFVRAAEGASVDDLRAAAEAITKEQYPEVRVQDKGEFTKAQETDVLQFLFVVFALVFLAIFIAVLGVMNTLALSVFERTQEIGLLRAVGMSRRQVRKMIRAEAVIIAVFGALLGIASGLLLGAALVVTLRSFIETTISIPYVSLLIVVVVAAIAGLAAALFPARRASKLDVLEAIATE